MSSVTPSVFGRIRPVAKIDTNEHELGENREPRMTRICQIVFIAESTERALHFLLGKLRDEVLKNL
jgi:hypothetical protein